MDNRGQSLYDILEVLPAAAQEEIHQAFMRAKSTYSPNSPALYSVFTPEEAEQLMRMIEEAYSILGNPIKRREYDASLKGDVNLSPDDVLTQERMGTNEKVARTPYSHYRVSKELEEEIGNQDVFDGTFFQRVREYKQISLDQMCAATRIGRQYMIALESNDFHALPAQVFVRGFIQQIARVLGLDGKKATDSFMKLFKQSRGA